MKRFSLDEYLVLLVFSRGYKGIVPFFSPPLFRAAPQHMEVPRARGPVGAIAASLGHSHSNARSQQHLRPTPPLAAKPDP